MSIHCVDGACTAAKAPRKTRGELAKNVDADYYGYRDEEDGIIVPLEQEEEKKGECNYGNVVCAYVYGTKVIAQEHH